MEDNNYLEFMNIYSLWGSGIGAVANELSGVLWTYLSLTDHAKTLSVQTKLNWAICVEMWCALFLVYLLLVAWPIISGHYLFTFLPIYMLSFSKEILLCIRQHQIARNKHLLLVCTKYVCFRTWFFLSLVLNQITFSWNMATALKMPNCTSCWMSTRLLKMALTMNLEQPEA